MLKLMHLEMKKFPIGGYIRGALIATFIIFAMTYFTIQGIEEVANMLGVGNMVSVLSNDTFLVFGAVMFARYVIKEYEKGTITVLFTYPISRKKIILAKMLIVTVFIIIALIGCNIINMGLFYLVEKYQGSQIVYSTAPLTVQSVMDLVFNLLRFAFMNTVSLFVGLWKKSTVATIVTSVLLVGVVGSSNNGDSLSNYAIIPITIGIIGFIVLYIMLRNVEQKDVK